MVLIESVSEGEKGYFPHIVHGHVSSDTTIPLTTVTHGQTGAEVVNILAWDQDTDWM